MSSVLDDLDHDPAAVLGRGRGLGDGADRIGDATFAADHPAEIAIADVDLEHGRAVSFDLVDADGVGIVDEGSNQVLDQVAHGG